MNRNISGDLFRMEKHQTSKILTTGNNQDLTIYKTLLMIYSASFRPSNLMANGIVNVTFFKQNFIANTRSLLNTVSRNRAGDWREEKERRPNKSPKSVYLDGEGRSSSKEERKSGRSRCHDRAVNMVKNKNTKKMSNLDVGLT